MKYFLGLLVLLLAGNLQAQLTTQKKEYTRADSLRGSLRPERNCYDVQFYELQISVDTLRHTISGSVEMRFKALTDIRSLQFDLNDSFKIESLTYAGKGIPYTREFQAVFAAFLSPIAKDSTATLKIGFSGKPISAKRAPWDGGFVWAHDANGKPWIGVACEGLGASSWWPCKDHNSDEPDLGIRVRCTVPKGLVAVVNGKKEGETSNKDSTVTYSWLVTYPINLYNVSLNIADYAYFSDKYVNADGSVLDLNYYVLPYHYEKAIKQFEQVKPMMKCYEQYFGKYPFQRDGYKLVETPYLGMEHQSNIAYGNQYKPGYAGYDHSGIGLNFDYIIIHESGHEWWGNSVSCNDMADMWLHESFCTYGEAVYVECLYGPELAQQYLNARKSEVGNHNPIRGQIRGVNEEGDGDMYRKGALMLNSIRTIVNNDSLWWMAIKSISDTAFKYKTTDGSDVVRYFCDYTHANLKPVFEQYLDHADIPELIYALKKKKGKTYEFTFHWKTDVENFEMPVLITVGNSRFRYNGSNEPKKEILTLQKLSQFSIDQNATYFKLLKP
ncbi:MAG: M1 family metallopeptidase [Chitinophagales bacterium]